MEGGSGQRGGGGGGSQGSKSRAAEDIETWEAFFNSFVNRKEKKSALLLSFLIVKKETAGVFRTPLSYERGVSVGQPEGRWKGNGD